MASWWLPRLHKALVAEGHTLGIARVRRYVPTPAEEMAAVAAELSEAIEAAHARRG
jgi:hypothetical protein